MGPTRFQRDIELWIGRLCGALDRREGDNLVSFVVYGSVARGTATVGSDADIFVVFRSLPARRHERFLLWHRALDELRGELGPVLADGRPFDWSVLMLTVDEATHRSPLYLDMTCDARLLIDRGDFFASVLEGLRARMRVVGSRRIALPDGSWYWDLAPGLKLGERVEL